MCFMTANDYFQYQKQAEFIRKLDERIEMLSMLLHMLDERIEKLNEITVNVDCKVIKPLKLSDIFKN